MTQLIRRFVSANAIGGAEFRLDNGQTLRGRNVANNGDVDILLVRSDDVVELQQNLQVNPLLPIPSALKELATVEYIQNYIEGKVDAKDSVLAIADSNIPLTGTAPLVIDGVTIPTNSRVGLVGQTNGTQNGTYLFVITTGNYTLTRTTDANSTDKVTSGMYFLVTNGTVYSGYECLLTTSDPITLGTTSLTFAKYPSTLSLTAGDMLTRTGNEWSIELAPFSGLESTNPGNIAGQLRVKTDTAALEKDQTTRRDSSTGAIMVKKDKKETFTLTATDITNQYIDLANVAGQDSIDFYVSGGGLQNETDDYTVNYTGGTASKTRITLAGGLATGGVSALISGDKITIKYKTF